MTRAEIEFLLPLHRLPGKSSRVGTFCPSLGLVGHMHEFTEAETVFGHVQFAMLPCAGRDCGLPGT